MCEPATLAWVAVGLTAATTVVSTVGAIQQGNAAKAQGEYNAQVSKNNAILAERQSADALRRGRLKERQTRLKLARRAGSERAALAASNVDLASGSAMDVIEFGAEQDELEALNIRNMAERESLGFKTRAANLTAESDMFRAAGKQAKTASLFKAGSSLLGGASQASFQASRIG